MPIADEGCCSWRRIAPSGDRLRRMAGQERWSGRYARAEQQSMAALDEAVLYRLIGSPKIVHDQLLHLADMFCHPNITVQIMPVRAGAHAGLLGGFAVATVDGAPGIVYLETSADGQALSKSSVVAQVALRFDTLRAVALPKDDSRELTVKVAEGRWTG